MSTIQHRDVFKRCFELSKELEAGNRLEDSVAVLRALQVYLDTFPAFPDGSCGKLTMGHLERASGLLREKQKSGRPQ